MRVASCGCGRSYYRGDWIELAFVGYQDDFEGGRLEIRDCRCGSSISIQVTPIGLTTTLRSDLAEVLRNDARELEGFPPSYEWPVRPRRDPKPEDVVEADRLHDIADELTGTSTKLARSAA